MGRNAGVGREDEDARDCRKRMDACFRERTGLREVSEGLDLEERRTWSRRRERRLVNLSDATPFGEDWSTVVRR